MFECGFRYVPPRQRGEIPDDKYRRGNENSVRVTNLSDDVAEIDLEVHFVLHAEPSHCHSALGAVLSVRTHLEDLSCC